jgi:hypothetical protein
MYAHNNGEFLSTHPLASRPCFILPLLHDPNLLFTYLEILLLLLVVRITVHSCPWFAINCPPLLLHPPQGTPQNKLHIFIDDINNISCPIWHTVEWYHFQPSPPCWTVALNSYWAYFFSALRLAQVQDRTLLKENLLHVVYVQLRRCRFTWSQLRVQIHISTSFSFKNFRSRSDSLPFHISRNKNITFVDK